jgi:hypothetical protein
VLRGSRCGDEQRLQPGRQRAVSLRRPTNRGQAGLRRGQRLRERLAGDVGRDGDRPRREVPFVPGVPGVADVRPVRLGVDAGELVVDDQPAAVATLHRVVETRPQVPDVARRHAAIAVDLDARVREMVARARVADENAAERAADPVAPLEHLAGHDLGAGIRREHRHGQLGVAPIDPLEVVGQHLLHGAHVVHGGRLYPFRSVLPTERPFDK